MNHKALLIPYNSQGQMFIQDRTGHKPPPWGFFGGGVEAGEKPLQAVIREAKEELNIDLTESDLIYLGEFPRQAAERQIERSLYLYRTEQESFTVLEGAGGHWVKFSEAAELLDIGDRLESIKDAIESVTGR